MCQIEHFSLLVYIPSSVFLHLLYIQWVRECCAFYRQLSINLSRQAAKLTHNCNVTALEGVSGTISMGGEKLLNRAAWNYLFKSLKEWDLMTLYQWD